MIDQLGVLEQLFPECVATSEGQIEPRSHRIG